MTKHKLFALLVCLGVALISVPASYGQAPPAQVLFLGAGSSAQFPTFAIAAVSADPITSAAAPCGTNFWSGGSSGSSSVAQAIDGRVLGITPVPHEPGTLWVAWDNDTTPTKVCAYLSVDSVVGQRLFLEQSAAGAYQNATLSLSAAAEETLGGNKVSFMQDNTTCTAGASPAAATVSSIALVSGTTYTFTATAPLAANFANGASVTISGTTNFNGVFAIGGVSAPGGTTFTFTKAGGPFATENAGTANVGANCPGIPPAVYTLLNGSHFNVGLTDIRAEDGVFANQRAGCAIGSRNTGPGGGAPSTCLGYGTGIGTAVLSSFTATSAQVVAYAVSGPDPISGFAVQPWVSTSIGAAPIVIIVNTNDAAAGGFGDPNVSNAPTEVLSNIYNGLAAFTADLNPNVLPNGAVINTVVEREPTSGTYNTFEWQVVRTATDGRTRAQEYGNNLALSPACFNPPAAPVACGNPLWLGGALGAHRARVIGTGDMVAAVNGGNAAISPTDSIGYAFWSLGTFGNLNGTPPTHMKYLTLNGADPLYATGQNPFGQGVFPSCSGYFNLGTFACAHTLPTFANLTGGNYQSFSVYRAITYSPVPAGVANLIQAAEDQAGFNGAAHIPDFVPKQICANAACSSFTQVLPVFRSHYGISGFAPCNANLSTAAPRSDCAPESGGDMAGAIFTVESELDYNIFVGPGAELNNYFQ